MPMIEKRNFVEEAAELRKRAEGKAARAQGKRKAMSSDETQQMLHELRVHQIELEMQNEELLRAQVELDAARARYFDLYDLAPIGYCTISEKGLILEANLTAANLLGESRGALVMQPLSRFILKEDQDIYYLHRKRLFGADTASAFDKATSPSRSTGRDRSPQDGKPQTCEVRMLKTDGTTFWVRLEANIAPALSPSNRHEADGAPVCHVIMSDITIHKKAAEILSRDRKTLESLVKERSDELIKIQIELERSKRLSDIGALAATVAHELRNPLFGIDLAVNILRTKKTGRIINHQLDVIYKMIEESGQIIDNLLSYSRLKSPQRKTFYPHSLIGECTDILQNVCIGKKIVISRHIDSLKDVSIKGDPVQIREVLTNILNNAADAVPDIGGEIAVKARVYRELVKIHITDNGHGIPKEDLKMVFEPFFTKKLKGTGLGLTVCSQIVKMHGGSINIKSRSGKGTTFTITLPRK